MPRPPSEPIYHSVVVALTAILPTDDGKQSHALSDAFDRCLEELAKLETSYILTAKDLRYKPTTRQSCFPACPFATLDPRTDEWNPIGSFVINAAEGRAPIGPAPLDDDGLFQLGVRVMLITKGSPLITFSERSVAAHRAYRIDGDYATAILNCYTSGEVLLNTLLLMMGWEELTFDNPSPITRTEIISWFSGRSTLESRVRAHFHRRLRGWDTENREKALYQWLDEVALLRNRVVHTGYRPNEKVTVRALDALRDLEVFIKEVFIDDRNRNRHPRTALMFFGVPGLMRRNCYHGKIKRIAEDSTEPDWLSSFVSFQRSLDDQILTRRQDQHT